MNSRKTKRRNNGQAIAEFGPALFLFLIIIFFPMLDLLGLAADYCMAWYANFAMCRELAVRKVADGIGAGATVPTGNAVDCSGAQVYADVMTNGFLTTGFASLLQINAKTCQQQANYSAVPMPDGSQPTVSCTTTLTATPFLTIPWPTPCPGMNQPMVFVIQSSRPREVTQ